MVINSALVGFEPKKAFPWNLSIMLQFDELNNNGMPAKNETDLIESFEKYLDKNLKISKKKPNVLFLARKTWNRMREYLYRVNDPETANNFLQDLINNKKYTREFEYVIKHDENWELNKWHLNALQK